MDPLQPAAPPATNPEPNDPSAGQRLSDQIDALYQAGGRLHELLMEGLSRSRDDLKSAFNSFAADTQRAYQRLRQELQGIEDPAAREARAARLAEQEGIFFRPGERFMGETDGRQFLRLAYSHVSEQVIADGIAKLGGILRACARN